jgi:hypothetical protein
MKILISQSGNERPCLECKQRGMTQTCVDGNRKIPKYLYGTPNITPAADLDCGTSLPQTTGGAHRGHTDITDYWTWRSNSFNQPGNTFTGPMRTHENCSIELGPNEFVNPATFHIESATLLLSRQMARAHLVKEDNIQTQSLVADMDLPMAMPVRGKRALCRKTSIGFTISSGWSNTFLPCGISEEFAGS